MNMSHFSRLKKAMKNKEYRDSFVEEHVRTGIPFQIRSLREKEEWTQKELGEKSGMAQERISVLEDPDYSKFTISTLLKLASAFDVGLTVRFVPFSKVLMEEANLSSTLIPASYNEDGYFHKAAVEKEWTHATTETSYDVGLLPAITGGALTEGVVTKTTSPCADFSKTGLLLVA